MITAACRSSVPLIPVFLCMSMAAPLNRAHAEQPSLHRQVDALVLSATEPSAQRSELAVCSDLEFLRRATLDLAGRIPTLGEIQAFETDARTSPAKRLAVVDRLLASNAFNIRMAEVLDVMLMERRGSDDHWQGFLREAMARRVGWDELAKHVVNPQADNETYRGAAGFLVKRLERYGQQPDDMPGLVRDVGRLFLGVDVQCAQCHDHLFVESYEQVDYQGLFAFVGQAKIRRDTAFPAVSQDLMTAKVEFTSVFGEGQQATGPRLPGGSEVEVPTFPKGEEYLQPPDRKTRFPGVPKFQPLEILAEQLADSSNEAFARNFANRIWWLLMGRGLVEPLDMHHPDNPPSHPQLLELLARESAANEFDIRWLVRELMQTSVYQLRGAAGADEPQGAFKTTAYRVAIERALSAEQLCRSMETAAALPSRLLAPCESPSDALRPVNAELLAAFREAFANPEKDPEVEYRPSVKAALFLRNSQLVRALFAPSSGGMVAEAAREDKTAIAERLFLQCLCRRPTNEESQDVIAFLDAYDDPQNAVSDLAWSLVSSAEFLLNH